MRFRPFAREHAVLFVALSTVTALGGCTALHEGTLRRELREAEAELAPREARRRPHLDGGLDGSLAAYVAYASAASPSLRASLERWRSETLGIAPARQLPEPMITYGFYFGPDMHRIMAEQELPWPTRLTRAADAQATRALAAQRRFEAEGLELRMRVAAAYWRLWSIRARRSVDREQLALLEALAEALRAGLAVGQASLADLAPVELGLSRLEDALLGLDEQERTAEAALRAAIGAPRGTRMPTVAEVPDPALPEASPETLAEAVSQHPWLASFALMADASEAEAEAIEGDRFPRLRLSVEGMFDQNRGMHGGQSPMEGVITSLGVSLPLAQDAYADRQRAARAEGEAQRAEGRAAEDVAQAELEAALAQLRDSHRRVALYARTLLPQAQAAYESLVGRLVAGGGELGAAMMAQRELLELRSMAIEARAEHGEAWARLERVVGRPVRVAEVGHE